MVEYNGTVSDSFSYANATVSFILAVIVIMANSSIILIFIKFKKVRDINNAAVTLLSIGDMLRGTIVMPPKIYNHYALATTLAEPLCTTTALTSAFTFVFNPMILAMIAVIRYCKISPGVNRVFFITEKRFKIACCCIVLTAALFALLPEFGVGGYAYSASHGVCFTDWSPGNKTFRILFYIIVVGLAFPILTICYTLLYLELRKHTMNMLSSYKTRGSQSEESSTIMSSPHNIDTTYRKSDSGDIQKMSTTSEKCNGATHVEAATETKEKKNAGIDKGPVVVTTDEVSVAVNSEYASTMDESYDDNRIHQQKQKVAKRLSRQEYQVTKLMIMIFIAYCVCWIPAAIVNIIAFSPQGQKGQPPEIYYTIVTLVELKSALNPLIYGLGNRKYRRAFKRLVRTYLLRKLV